MSLRGACNFHWRGVAVHLARPEPPEQAEAAVLDATERSRAAAFRFEPDRNLYVAAHVFLRHTLSRHAPIAPAEWRFSANAYGKPFITNPGHTSLQFNLSHTDGLIACAISQGQAVGVDVEQCKPMPDLDNLCRYALSAREAEDVLAIHDGAQQVQRFLLTGR
ncbi:MAG: hypothetical protein HZT40_09270 [Candidatus Thiothrix singaporensis]|uniref:4'-phosphopantetheinyl transferase N-terminal domain-containing protein n=1 Tax=Candidatus Thiothrix singaporensis TaxID=2799669 RepID=A0A7L6ARJ7_9GAMM|nr:MAG: hypothetical protein HZT40_09270 [Candidatus Thiothrix singaporensis]